MDEKESLPVSDDSINLDPLHNLREILSSFPRVDVPYVLLYLPRYQVFCLFGYVDKNNQINYCVITNRLRIVPLPNKYMYDTFMTGNIVIKTEMKGSKYCCCVSYHGNEFTTSITHNNITVVYCKLCMETHDLKVNMIDKTYYESIEQKYICIYNLAEVQRVFKNYNCIGYLKSQ
jgi:hypothetical protein